MNQGKFEALLAEAQRTNALLGELIRELGRMRPVVLAVPADAKATDLMKEITAALYDAPPGSQGIGTADDPPPAPKAPPKAKPKRKRKPKAGDGVKVA